MKTIEKELLENYNLLVSIDNRQYFVPTYKYVGLGLTEKEALEDCLENLVQTRDDLSEGLIKALEKRAIKEHTLSDESLTEHSGYKFISRKPNVLALGMNAATYQ